MADTAQLNVDVIFGSKNARELANTIGTELSKASRKWQSQVKREFGDAIVSASDYAFSSGQSGKAIRNMMKSELLPLYTEFNKQLREGNTEAAEKLQRAIDARTKSFKRELDAMAAAHERVMKNQNRSMAERADSVKGILSTLRGGPEGILNALRGGGSKLADQGKDLQDLGGKRGKLAAKVAGPEGAKAAESAASMAKMGATMAKVGTALATVAAVVGVVVMLVKLFADLESKIKDMNKQLLSTAGASDFGLGSVEIRSGKLNKQLKEMRDQTTSLNENFMKFRASSKEQQQILSTFNEAGLSYGRMNQEIEKGSSFMKNYSDVTAIALTYSRNLGVATGEISQKMGQFAFETGSDLTEIAEGFSIIQREAMVAGFVSKRFYSTIIEVTSGLNFYGVRLEETAKLLTNLDSLMGEHMGAKMMKDIAQSGAKGYQASLQEFIVKDPSFFKAAYETTYRQRLAQYERQFADKLGGATVEQLIKETGGGAALSERLAGLGITGQKSTDLLQLADVGRAGASGDVTAMAAARGAAGPAFEQVAALKTMEALGGTVSQAYEQALDQGEAGIGQLIATAGVANKEQLDELVRLDQHLRGQFDLLEKVAKGTEKMPEHLAELGYYIEGAGTEDAKVMKGVMDATGHRDDRNAEEITGHLQQLLVEPSEDGKALKEQMTKDQQIASDISREITGLNDIMEQTIAALLNELYDGLMSIYEWMVRDDTARLADAAYQRTAKRELEALASQEKTIQEEISNLAAAQEKARTEGDKAEVSRIGKEIKGKEGELLGVNQAATAFQIAQQKRQSMTVEERLGTRGAGALGSLGGEVKVGATRGKDVGSMVDQIVGDRLTKDVLFAGDIVAGLQDFGEWTGALQSLGDKAMTKFTETGLTKEFGEDKLKAAVKIAEEAGAKAREDQGWWASSDEVRQAEEEAFAGALNAVLVPIFTAAANQQQAIADEEEQSTKEVRDAVLVGTAPLQKPTQGGDLILPARGGPPIITDPADTTYAAKPGGPIAAAMGGGGGGGGRGGGVTVNVYGGDQKKVYDTIMRVLKATGNA